MDINVKVIPHKEQRYETVGDWWFVWSKEDGGRSHVTSLEIRVSDMGNVCYNFLVARHEQDEAMLCLERGISEEDVSTFDIKFEEQRSLNNPNYTGEPGDNYLAPYRKEHFFATTQERAMAAELKVDWEEYDAAVNAL